MLKCPYCFEILEAPIQKCPHCGQFLIDPVVKEDYKSIDKKNCIFCGKRILTEAKVCRFCKKWLDSVDEDTKHLDNIE
jgi:hypothetical protein